MTFLSTRSKTFSESIKFRYNNIGIIIRVIDRREKKKDLLLQIIWDLGTSNRGCQVHVQNPIQTARAIAKASFTSYSIKYKELGFDLL